LTVSATVSFLIPSIIVTSSLIRLRACARSERLSWYAFSVVRSFARGQGRLTGDAPA
jgi:hypothetical protein